MVRFTIRGLLFVTLVVGLILGLWRRNRDSVPRLFREEAIACDSFAESVNHFVNLGEKEAVAELERLASDDMWDYEGGWSANERVGWMCRILFESKNTGPLREPRYGGLSLPYHTMPDKSWPLYPVALSGSTYFVLSERYMLGGVAENPKDYIAYCREAGTFRKKPVVVPTKAEALNDAAALRQSAEWKSIKWTDSGQGWSYTFDEKWTWEFIQNQAQRTR